MARRASAVVALSHPGVSARGLLVALIGFALIGGAAPAAAGKPREHVAVLHADLVLDAAGRVERVDWVERFDPAVRERLTAKILGWRFALDPTVAGASRVETSLVLEIEVLHATPRRYTLRSATAGPRIAERTELRLPEATWRNRVEGQTTVAGCVDPEGRIGPVRIVNGSGSASLDTAVARAVRQWRFKVERADGVGRPFLFETTLGIDWRDGGVRGRGPKAGDRAAPRAADCGGEGGAAARLLDPVAGLEI